ncbi:Severe Depolymerization of Actin, partial [Dispira parvispora]
DIVIAESDEEDEHDGSSKEGDTMWVTDSEDEASVASESEDEFASAVEDVDQSMDEGEEADSDEEKVGLENNQPDDSNELRPRIDQLRILTPQDFRMIDELKLKKKAMESVHGVKSRQSNLKRRMEAVSAGGNSVMAVNQEDLERVVDASEIIGDYRKKPKATYEERMESIQAGREGRPKFASSKRRKNEHASLSNSEKKKNKAYTMILHKKSVVLKNKVSLREKQRLLRGHIKRQKRKGH